MDNQELEERLNFIEYRQELLFEDSRTSRIYFEYKITREQSGKIADLFDEYRNLIESKEKVTHHGLETKMYNIVPQLEHNYHFVESVAQAFYESGSWEEVFETLYGSMPKYQHYMSSKN
ncbi:DUF1878 domain-containing protein [Paenibacillus sp. HWE-109]|uniref:DUF1878 domain-containing protein n=1 Tax=Paenibacillus sp. HWE-109 TaxID=1306526 RepID=UPI001EE13A01|nr:DUF1878 domain-containing protein [Paenibacillus sp. HWE-109]UKS25007.1 DUF1878 domain-containing protein [Paenibacillus sp. HWE-109]